MYQIKLGNYVLYDLRDEEFILENPELNLEVNKVGSLSFSIYPNHPYFNRINKLSSVITVLKNNNVIFKGRVISEEQGLYNSKKIECEGILGYLNDSIVRPYSFTGTPEEYFKNLLENHNNQVIGNLFDKNNLNELSANVKDGLINSSAAERTLYIKCEKNTAYTFSKLRGTIYPRFTIAETTDIPTIGSTISNSYYSADEIDTYTTSSTAEYLVFWYYCNDSELTHQEVLDSIKIVKGNINETKVIKVGEITVTDPNDYITRSSINYASTWDILNEDLINKLGGYLKVRYESDGTYIDYLSDFNDTSTQIIEFGENLIDVLVKNDAIDVYTAVIPLGAEIQNDDGTSEKLTIKSVNNDLDYIVNQEAFNKYGLIFAPVENTTWDDVTVASNLLTKATNYLNNQAVMLKSSLELSAIDLNIVDSSIENFFIYEYVRFISSVHNINERYLLTKITIPISSPENMKITLGKEISSLTGIEMGNKQNIDKVIERVGRIESNYKNEDGKLNEIREEIITNTTSIQQNQEEILMTALENYTSKTEFETYQNEITSQFQQTSDNFQFNINNVVSQINSVNDNTQQQFQEISTYFRITADGTELGKSDSDIILRQSNDRISFIQNNTEVAYISDSTLYITDAHFLVSIRIGNFAFKPRANGNLSLVKVN